MLDKDPKDYIIIQGARVHNLKNVSVAVPKNKLVVITGVSGSGKSSLAFDTLYAEGQRRYIESLSSYARQFLGKMDKPDVDFIHGIAPCIAIEQKVNTSNPRSTVGTSTEIYDYLKILFARIGRTYSPISGLEVKKHAVSDVVNYILQTKHMGKTALIYAPFDTNKDRTLGEELNVLQQKGFSRVFLNSEVCRIDDLLEDKKLIQQKLSVHKEFKVVIDRVLVAEDEDTSNRLGDSVQTAFAEAGGDCEVEIEETIQRFSNRFELDGLTFDIPSPNFFSFNNSYGACKTCEGFGSIIDIDPDLVIPNKAKSVYDDAIACWRGPSMSRWKQEFISTSAKYNFPIHRSYEELSTEEIDLLWNGKDKVQGINHFFEWLQEQAYQVQYRVLNARYRGRTTCKDCKGSRLRKDASYVKVGGLSITDLVLKPIENLLRWFEECNLNEFDAKVADRLLVEIKNRLSYLCDVGLGYLTLNRLSNTLSGGESQRINLATSLGSSLVGSVYVLDEPSIGLHSRDTQRLIKVLRNLQEAGNTVVVVEHDEEIMKAADYIIDIGPLAGIHGGELVFEGDYQKIINDEASLTGKYLSGKLAVDKPTSRRKWSDFIEIQGVRQNNLKNIDVKFPLHALTVVTGVSGSGKTSLVKQVFVPALQKQIGEISKAETGKFTSLSGSLDKIAKVELVDQNPIGRSSRSNPVSYIKAWDDIRDLFSKLPKAKQQGLKPGSFSFNVEGGRCETCEGEGEVTVSMQFMADIRLTCEECGGKRFKNHILEITYKDCNVYDILDMSVDEALPFFETDAKIYDKIKVLSDVGLGYVKLGQSSSTLSGGEAQRVKLASFLLKGAEPQKTLFVFDEPTTGLHFHDIGKLMQSFQNLLAKGASIIIIEHNMDVIKSADWIIDIGPDGGEKGGQLVFEGTPEAFVQNDKSFTASYLKDKLA